MAFTILRLSISVLDENVFTPENERCAIATCRITGDALSLVETQGEIHMEEGARLLVFSTSLIHPKLRARAFRRWLGPFADVFFIDDASVNASISAYSVGNVHVALTESGAAHYVRSKDTIRKAGTSDYVLFQLILNGEIKAYFGHKSINLSRGDIFFIDLSASYESWTSYGQCVCFLVPHTYLQKVARFIHGRVIQKDSLAGLMLADHLARCVKLLQNDQESAAITAVHTALDLIIQCLIDAQFREDHVDFSHGPKRAVLEYIEENLTCPSLDSDHIALLFNISRATLYRMFAEFGGVQQFIRDRRLDAALHDICRNPGMSISEVACRYGFSNDRQFQRAFRAKFGVTARDARADWQSDQFGHPPGSHATF